MNLSKLLHQILYHAHKILTKQHFLTENVSPEIFHQLFMLFVCWWWVGKLGPFAQRRGGSLHFQSDSWEQEPLCSFTQLHRNSAGTQNLGRFLPGVPWEFLLLPDSSVEENEDFGAAKKHCTSKLQFLEKIPIRCGICEHLEAIPEEIRQTLPTVRKDPRLNT